MPLLTTNPNYAKTQHFKFKVTMPWATPWGVVFLKKDKDLAEFLSLCKDNPSKVEETQYDEPSQTQS